MHPDFPVKDKSDSTIGILTVTLEFREADLASNNEGNSRSYYLGFQPDSLVYLR